MNILIKYIASTIVIFSCLLPLSIHAQICNHFELYDQLQSAFHGTIAKLPDGNFTTWGAQGRPTGADAPSPIIITPANGYNYTGMPLHASISSAGTTAHQRVLLTTTGGIYAWGQEDECINTSLTSNENFGLTTLLLPTGVDPSDVRQFTAFQNGIYILTHSGSVYVSSAVGPTDPNLGGPVIGQWASVQDAGGIVLTGVTHIRMELSEAFAYTSDGRWWTWGPQSRLGDGSTFSSRNRATEMNAPFAGAPKMIGLTRGSYYALSPSGLLLTLGRNHDGQLGIGSTVDQNNWVHVRNSTNTANLTNVKFVSGTTRVSGDIPAVGVITNNNDMFLWGNNSGGKIAGTATIYTLPRRPDGFVFGTDIPLYLEVGGHTSAYVKACHNRYCYTGHRIDGSMGNGTLAESSLDEFNCTATPVASICGATSFDSGDSPATYENGNSGVHMMTACSAVPFLGSISPIPNNGGLANVVSGADNNGSNGDGTEEDGLVAVHPYDISGSYSVDVRVTNNTGSPANLYAWVDWNSNGVFEASEIVTVSVPSAVGLQTIPVTWTSISGFVAGNNYMRLRLSSGALTDNVGTTTIDERSIGLASDGEIEDYLVESLNVNCIKFGNIIKN